ncbi:MAG: GDSL-type esterase/lipase family protein [Candidatus Limisoma sp.]
MKHILLVLSVMMFSYLLGFANDWANKSRYAESNAEVLKLDKSQRCVVLMGNSITDGWPVADSTFFVDHGFVGRGISGQVSAQMRERFADDVIALEPTKVFILCGTNDIAENAGPYDEDATFANVVAMVEMAIDNDIVPYVCSVLPARRYPWNLNITGGPQKIERLNLRLRQYATELGIGYVDYFTPMVADDGESLREEYTFDGVHPTLDGYKVMEAVLLRTVD